MDNLPLCPGIGEQYAGEVVRRSHLDGWRPEVGTHADVLSAGACAADILRPGIGEYAANCTLPPRNFNALPESMVKIAVLIGLERTLLLMEVFGGQMIYINRARPGAYRIEDTLTPDERRFLQREFLEKEKRPVDSGQPAPHDEERPPGRMSMRAAAATRSRSRRSKIQAMRDIVGQLQSQLFPGGG